MDNNWREFFSCPGADPWIVCERALAFAFRDRPDEFPAKRDRLAQKLFAPEKLDLQACESGIDVLPPPPCKGRLETPLFAEDEEEGGEGEGTPAPPVATRSSSYDVVEALTEELEDEMLSKRDVLSIIAALKDPDQAEREIYEMLQRLELMQVSFDILKETHIGKAVNEVRNHSNASKRVAALAKRLVRGWKDLAQVCLRSVTDVATAAREEDVDVSGSMLLEEEPGLPSPPMDEAALFTTPMSAVDMFQACEMKLWDLDDVASGSDYQNTVENHTQYSRPQPSHKLSSEQQHGSFDSCQDGEPDQKMSRLANVKDSNVINCQQKKNGLRKPPSGAIGKMESPEHRIKGSQLRSEAVKPSMNQVSKDDKMETTKKNLRVNYEREENAKRQRTIQVLDLRDLPKNGPARAKSSHMIHGRLSSHIRPRVLSCR